MAAQFLLCCFWFCLVVLRDSGGCGHDVEGSPGLLFTPSRLVVRSSAVLCAWRNSSHLRPQLRPLVHRNSCRRRAWPTCYWLILLAGDVESNPGPTKYPCTLCNKAVRSNQRAIACSRCENWTHANCCGVSAAEYRKLGEQADEPWYCPSCMMSELPYFNTSVSDCHVEENTTIVAPVRYMYSATNSEEPS